MMSPCDRGTNEPLARRLRVAPASASIRQGHRPTHLGPGVRVFPRPQLRSNRGGSVVASSHENGGDTEAAGAAAAARLVLGPCLDMLRGGVGSLTTAAKEHVETEREKAKTSC